MGHLLDLPREIRDHILSILLRDPLAQQRPTPALVQKANTRRDPNDASARKIRYPSAAPPESVLKSLMLVNRQLNHEVHEAIEHFTKCGMANLTLDVLVESNKWLFPTWISALPYCPIVKQLRVQLRPFANLSSSAEIGNPFVAAWHFGDLLNAVLKHGPGFNFSLESKQFVVEELLVDIVTDLSMVNPGHDDSEVIDRAKSLRDFMVAHIDGFLVVIHKRYHVPWGPILLSRVHKLKIVAAEETLLELDVLLRAHDCNIEILEPLRKRRRSLDSLLKVHNVDS